VVVARGVWQYDETVPTEVLVVRLDYDFWYAVGEADGELADGEVPALNADGHLYYVRTTPGWVEGEPFWPDSTGAQSVDDAKAEAQGRVPAPIAWG
jgi:hypothetical protein